MDTKLCPHTFFNVNINDSNGCSLFSIDKSVVHVGGSIDVDLEDGIKSPDFSLYEDYPMKQPLTQRWPMVRMPSGLPMILGDMLHAPLAGCS